MEVIKENGELGLFSLVRDVQFSSTFSKNKECFSNFELYSSYLVGELLEFFTIIGWIFFWQNNWMNFTLWVIVNFYVVREVKYTLQNYPRYYIQCIQSTQHSIGVCVMQNVLSIFIWYFRLSSFSNHTFTSYSKILGNCTTHLSWYIVSQ